MKSATTTPTAKDIRDANAEAFAKYAETMAEGQRLLAEGQRVLEGYGKDPTAPLRARGLVTDLIYAVWTLLRDARATKSKAPVENREKPAYKPDMDGLSNYLKSRGVPESLQPKLAAKLDAVVTAEITGREAAPQLSEGELGAFMTPQRVAALTADTPLGRLQVRYEKRLQEIVLPEDKIKDAKQARAAALLVATYRNLVKQQTKAGLKPQPQDERVTKAQRLRMAFYREQKAGHAPRRRGRPPKFAMNALA